MSTIIKKGHFNINRLKNFAGWIEPEQVQTLLKSIEKQIAKEEGALYACPDLCMILWMNNIVTLGGVTYENYNKPKLIGEWKGKKVFMKRNFLTEWELRNEIGSS